MDENLIGYLLDALDPPTKQEVEAYLHGSPEAQTRLEHLRRALAPLAEDAVPPEPPPALVIATLARVAEHRCPSLPAAPPPRSGGQSGRRWFRRADLIAATLLVILVGGVGLPFLMWQRHHAQRLACENNLHTLWGAFASYGDQHDNHFPKVAEQGPRGFAGMFMPTLAEAGFLKPERWICCPPRTSPSERSPSVEDLKPLWEHPDREELQRQVRELAGNYAYSLGYRANGVLFGPRCDDDSNKPLLADHRPANTRQLNSPNHGGYGQNVLYIGGQVRWCTSPNVGECGDNIYFNQQNKVQAGLNPHDTVLGSGDARACPPD